MTTMTMAMPAELVDGIAIRQDSNSSIPDPEPNMVGPPPPTGFTGVGYR